jgi:hypothetical protein
MPYQPFDIVMLRPEFGTRVYAIVEPASPRPETGYVAVRLEKGPLAQRYRLAEAQIWAKIGTLDPAALKLDPASVERPPPPDWRLGQHFARFQAQHAPTELERRRWAVLADLQPGDPIAIQRYTRRGVRIEPHRFREVLPAGQKYHFSAINANGTVYRWTLESVHLSPEEDKNPKAGGSATPPPEST